MEKEGRESGGGEDAEADACRGGNASHEPDEEIELLRGRIKREELKAELQQSVEEYFA
jgi:hypothetical protein